MNDPIEIIPLLGFDPDGEPEIRRMADGSLCLVFEFMPPMWMPESTRIDLGCFENFDGQMQQAIGVPVVWEDREVFLIQKPKKDTVDLIRRFLSTVRQRHDTSE